MSLVRTPTCCANSPALVSTLAIAAVSLRWNVSRLACARATSAAISIDRARRIDRACLEFGDARAQQRLELRRLVGVGSLVESPVDAMRPSCDASTRATDKRSIFACSLPIVACAPSICVVVVVALSCCRPSNDQRVSYGGDVIGDARLQSDGARFVLQSAQAFVERTHKRRRLTNATNARSSSSWRQSVVLRASASTSAAPVAAEALWQRRPKKAILLRIVATASLAARNSLAFWPSCFCNTNSRDELRQKTMLSFDRSDLQFVAERRQLSNLFRLELDDALEIGSQLDAHAQFALRRKACFRQRSVARLE